MRLDFQSVAVMTMATASSLSVAFWLAHAEPGAREVRAETVRVLPEPKIATRGGAAQVMRAPDGHYWAEAEIDGRAVRVLVDTGASVVALTRQDALRLGLRLEPGDFTRTVQTAAGPARAAPVILETVSVAGANVEAVDALVVESGLSHSLLGMSYLGRLSGFEATQAALTLRP